MAEQGLRAMDLRHTLPNLKNLILTLTHNTESTPPYVPMRIYSFSYVLKNNLVSTIRVAPVPLDIPPEDTIPTPRAASPLPVDNAPAPVASRSSFLSPLTAMLRSRYTGSSTRPKVVVEVPEPTDGLDGLTPTAAYPSPAQPQLGAANPEGNSSASENGTNKDEAKPVPQPHPPNGLEKLSDGLPAKSPPSSPFSHTVN